MANTDERDFEEERYNQYLLDEARNEAETTPDYSERCNCEHTAHFPEHDDFHDDTPPTHPYQSVPAGMWTCRAVGHICDECAEAHYSDIRDWLRKRDITA